MSARRLSTRGGEVNSEKLSFQTGDLGIGTYEGVNSKLAVASACVKNRFTILLSPKKK